MAFPWTFESNFEAGTNAEWDSETDGDGKLNIQHFTRLAGIPNLDVPYRGAYAMHIDLTGGTSDAYVQDTAFAISADATLHIRFYFYATGLVMAASDRFSLFTFEQADGTDEATIDILNNAGTIQLVGADPAVADRALTLVQGVWHAVEMTVHADAGGGDDGTIDFYVDGLQVGTQITGIDQGTIAHARMGALGIDAGTTAGHLLFDQVIADDARVYPVRERFPQGSRLFELTKSGHAVVGPGRLSRVSLRSGTATNNVLRFFDTDEANVNDTSNMITLPFVNLTNDEVLTHEILPDDGHFERGCYVEFAGTDPRAYLTFDDVYNTSGLVRRYASVRKPHGVV